MERKYNEMSQNVPKYYKISYFENRPEDIINKKKEKMRLIWVDGGWVTGGDLSIGWVCYWFGFGGMGWGVPQGEYIIFD